MEIKAMRAVITTLAVVLAGCVGAPFTWETDLGTSPAVTTSEAGPQLVDSDAAAVVAPALGDAVTLTKVDEASVPDAATDAASVYPDAFVSPPPLPVCPRPEFYPYWAFGWDAGPYTYTMQIGEGASFSVRVLANNVQPGVFIHYTTDGSMPGYASPVFDYNAPIDVTGPMVIRAFADGPGTCVASAIYTATVTDGDAGVLDVSY
jgi:hypothetical protein